MMELIQENRIDAAFKKGGKVLNIYFTAGFPSFEDTTRIIKALENAGADMVEIGMPYSDPVADGPTIQESNQKALDGGMTIAHLFEQLEDIRMEVNIPIILMGYLNPVMQYGVEKFLEKCAEIGIDGTILPDMPLPEYVKDYQKLYKHYGIHNIFLITPQTSEERIKQIDEMSGGFIYMVAANSITGAKAKVENTQLAYFQRIEKMELQNPKLIGFGISDNKTFEQACSHADGAIIGSAFINLLKNSDDLEEDITAFVKKVKGLS
ncbi:tryptophan synthase subunit alpha [Flammeovirgaceae bacterium SG7u.111]|nr:tryptophan synthase subunit alpha [Flammeovirgaceae bacterium SG7u.132]WPO35335.1 tryptophan synthase subunit alpha [Flammeovirgaceae bacterium SG7u.111]